MYQGRDITDEIDHEVLVEYLKTLECTKPRKRYFPHLKSAEGAFELSNPENVKETLRQMFAS